MRLLFLRFGLTCQGKKSCPPILVQNKGTILAQNKGAILLQNKGTILARNKGAIPARQAEKAAKKRKSYAVSLQNLAEA